MFTIIVTNTKTDLYSTACLHYWTAAPNNRKVSKIQQTLHRHYRLTGS